MKMQEWSVAHNFPANAADVPRFPRAPKVRKNLMKEKLYSIKKNSGRSDAWKSFKISKRTLLNKEKRHSDSSVSSRNLSAFSSVSLGITLRTIR